MSPQAIHNPPPFEFESLSQTSENIFFVAFIQKIQLVKVGFFICADRHNIVCVAHATSLPFAAQMNEIEALPQMMLQQVANDAILRINDVALRANGAVTVCLVR